MAIDKENNFKGLFFCTEEMRMQAVNFSEIIFVDGTYKLFLRKFVLMLLLVQDARGHGQIVGVGILADEQKDTLKWFISCFMRENPEACQKVQSLMGDKDLKERDVIKQMFPGRKMYICLFHALRTFDRQVSKKAMGISRDEKLKLKSILEQMAKSNTEDRYNNLYQKLKLIAPEKVMEYFDASWDPIKEEWCIYAMNCGNLGNFTNNLLESVNGKIKDVAGKYNTLLQFANLFFTYIYVTREENAFKDFQTTWRKDIDLVKKSSVVQFFSKALYSKSFQIVEEQISLSEALTVQNLDPKKQFCNFKMNSNMIKSTPTTCDCFIFKSYLLPCRHIFRTRTEFGLDLCFLPVETIRWTKSYQEGAEKAMIPVNQKEKEESINGLLNKLLVVARKSGKDLNAVISTIKSAVKCLKENHYFTIEKLEEKSDIPLDSEAQQEQYLSSRVKFLHCNRISKQCTFQFFNRELKVTPCACECQRWTVELKLCRHMIAARKLFSVSLELVNHHNSNQQQQQMFSLLKEMADIMLKMQNHKFVKIKLEMETLINYMGEGIKVQLRQHTWSNDVLITVFHEGIQEEITLRPEEPRKSCTPTITLQSPVKQIGRNKKFYATTITFKKRKQTKPRFSNEK